MDRSYGRMDRFFFNSFLILDDDLQTNVKHLIIRQLCKIMKNQ